MCVGCCVSAPTLSAVLASSNRKRFVVPTGVVSLPFPTLPAHLVTCARRRWTLVWQSCCFKPFTPNLLPVHGWMRLSRSFTSQSCTSLQNRGAVLHSSKRWSNLFKPFNMSISAQVRLWLSTSVSLASRASGIPGTYWSFFSALGLPWESLVWELMQTAARAARSLARSCIR